MRFRLLPAFLLAGIAMAAPSASQAGLVSSHLSFNGVEDTIDDNSRSVIYDNNSNNLLDIGDDIVGLIRFDAFNGTNVASGELIFAVFGLRLTGFFDGGLGQTHGAIATGDASSLPSLIDDALKPAAFAADAAWSSSIFAILTSTTAANPFATNVSPVTSIGAMTAAAGWTLEVIGGLVGDDFFETELDDDAVVDIGDGVLPLTISEIIADNDGDIVLKERMAASILYHDFGSAVTFLQVSTPKFSGGTADGDIILQPAGSVQTSTASSSASHFEDDANFVINAVPEPGSLTLLGLGLIGLVGAKLRRRKSESVDA